MSPHPSLSLILSLPLGRHASGGGLYVVIMAPELFFFFFPSSATCLDAVPVYLVTYISFSPDKLGGLNNLVWLPIVQSLLGNFFPLPHDPLDWKPTQSLGFDCGNQLIGNRPSTQTQRVLDWCLDGFSNLARSGKKSFSSSPPLRPPSILLNSFMLMDPQRSGSFGFHSISEEERAEHFK